MNGPEYRILEDDTGFYVQKLVNKQSRHTEGWLFKHTFSHDYSRWETLDECGNESGTVNSPLGAYIYMRLPKKYNSLKDARDAARKFINKKCVIHKI